MSQLVSVEEVQTYPLRSTVVTEGNPLEAWKRREEHRESNNPTVDNNQCVNRFEKIS